MYKLWIILSSLLQVLASDLTSDGLLPCGLLTTAAPGRAGSRLQIFRGRVVGGCRLCFPPVERGVRYANTRQVQLFSVLSHFETMSRVGQIFTLMENVSFNSSSNENMRDALEYDTVYRPPASCFRSSLSSVRPRACNSGGQYFTQIQWEWCQK